MLWGGALCNWVQSREAFSHLGAVALTLPRSEFCNRLQNFCLCEAAISSQANDTTETYHCQPSA